MSDEDKVALLKYQKKLLVQDIEQQRANLDMLFEVGEHIIMSSELPVYFEMKPKILVLSHAVFAPALMEHLSEKLKMSFTKTADGRYMSLYKQVLVIFGSVKM